MSTDIPQSGFLPGETYSITVSMKESSRTIFGFQSLLFGEAAQSGVGTIQLTDTERTRTITASGNTYAEQSKTGSAAVDSAIWSFDWLAPDKGTGDVTIYTAAMAANGNGNKQGDRVYTSALLISENPTASLVELSEVAEAQLYPNPVQDQLSIRVTLSEPTPMRWQIHALDGRLVSSGETSTQSGSWNKVFDLSSLANGLYLLEIRTNSGRWTERILKR